MEDERTSRLEWRPGDIYVIRNENMQCISCKHLIPHLAVECEIYQQKPRFVTNAEQACPHYVPQANS